MEPQENARLKRELAKYSSVSVSYHLMADYVSLLTRRNKIEVNARVRGHDKLLFEKSDGDIRALITSMDARDLLRIVSADEDFRKQTDVEDFGLLKQKGILQDAFEDNVRIYLKQRSKINRNIKETAVSDLRMRFFYYNNGITMTCKRFGYSKTKYPIIEIEGLQVVNGGQTIHALFDAYCENSTDFEQIEVLCRIYETNDAELSTTIAEYTNSQNPVKIRDIRSNDYIQKKLETELQAKGYFYERKKNQHADKPKAKRIDMEKAGQALMAFYNEMPAEAKDNKPLIFGDKYEDVFNDDVTADRVIAVSSLLDEIENKKKSGTQGNS